MASPREPLDNYSYTALGSAIKRVWDAKGRSATITDIYELLGSGLPLSERQTFATDDKSAKELQRPSRFF